VVLRRALSGHPIHKPDKRHIHHQLLERGLSHRQTVLLLYGVTLLLALLAVWLFVRTLG
jgi:UDP-GlcNAc:undecaprenyl-phosphate GlcNAc-1-phosphate transferase